MPELAMEAHLIHRAWLLCGWVIVAVVIWITLTPQPPHIPFIFPSLEKLGHVIAYLVMTTWFAAALPGRKRLACIMVGFIVLGGLLEILQGFTGRDPEWLDWFRDSAGVILGATWPRLWFGRLHDYLVIHHANPS